MAKEGTSRPAGRSRLARPKASTGITEDAWNAELRTVFRSQGLSCMHVRETEKPGAADLPVWKGAEIVAWLELKLMGHGLDPQQREFLRDRDAECGAAFVLRYFPKGPTATDAVLVQRGADPLWATLVTVAEVQDWRTERWQPLLWRLRRDGLRYK